MTEKLQEIKQKSLKTSMNMTYAIIGSCLIYAFALSNAGIDYKTSVPSQDIKPSLSIQVEAQSNTINQTAEIEPLSVVANTDEARLLSNSEKGNILANTENATKTTLENWLKKQNPDLPAQEIAECSYKYTTERKINHFLPLAITEKESNTWSHYKIQQMDGKWVDYRRGQDNFDDVKKISIKQYRDHYIYYNGGGIMGRSKDWSNQTYSSKNLEYTLNFKGSIAGYTSYCEYLDNLTWLLDVGYPTTHTDNLSQANLDQFAKVYVGTTSYKQYSQTILSIINKIKSN